MSGLTYANSQILEHEREREKKITIQSQYRDQTTQPKAWSEERGSNKKQPHATSPSVAASARVSVSVLTSPGPVLGSPLLVLRDGIGGTHGSAHGYSFFHFILMCSFNILVAVLFRLFESLDIRFLSEFLVDSL